MIGKVFGLLMGFAASAVVVMFVLAIVVEAFGLEDYGGYIFFAAVIVLIVIFNVLARPILSPKYIPMRKRDF